MNMRISIAIPTRERADYLGACLRTCVAIADPDVEIIVSDNASADHTQQVVEGFADPRIRYLNTGARVSMRQNFENAINATRGEYVIMMGDDDAIAPGQFPLLRQILQARKPKCLSWRSRYYLWPDKLQPDGGGRLKLASYQSFGAISAVNAPEILTRLVEARLSGHDVVPMIYHGAVHRSVIEALRARTGQVFGCSVPDVYFQVAANAFIDEVLFVEHPFSIQAISPKSTGFSARFSGERGKDNAIDAFAREAAADPILDPMPGKMPAIELYWLNAIEQANRLVYRGELPLNYAEYFRRALKGFRLRPAFERELGLDSLRRLAVDVGEGKALEALIAAHPPAASGLRHLHALDAVLKRARRFQPSSISPKRMFLDLKAFGAGDVFAAASTLDHILGQADIADLSNSERAASRWKAARTRGFRLWRDAMLRRVPAFLAERRP